MLPKATYMKKRLALFSTQVRVGITENEADGGEEVTLAGSVATHDHIVFRRERFNDCLVLVAVVVNSPLARRL